MTKVQHTPSVPIKPEKREAASDREIIGKDGALMVLVPAGEFWMGSSDGEGIKHEHPRHQVALDAFYMDKFEATTGRFVEFAQETNRSKSAQVSSEHRLLPATQVDWHDAKAYCEWAGKRLPTEAEWEKAARGTDGRTYPWGNEPPTARLANFGQEITTKKPFGEYFAPVDSYEAGKSPYGLHHMAGNVSEWVADWYDENYYGKSPSRNPKGPVSGEDRVFRGGSWNLEPEYVRAADRFGSIPINRVDRGFRCAQDVPQ